MPKTFFITTAIYYTNSSPHVGHAYEMVLADVIARYHRLKGENVFFLTGVDQHGQKVQQSAAKAGVPPEEFVKGITQKWIDLAKDLNVQYDDWVETTSDRHKKVVQGILQRLWDEKDPTTGESCWIYKAKQAGYYSVRQEQFLTDKERGPDGQFGPEWGEIEFREEENYYFRLNQHKEWLLQYLHKRTNAVIPDFRQMELRNAVEKLSGDLCISRPKSRLDWGIELPFDKDFVTYVWFDALTNYISFAGYDANAAAPGLRPVGMAHSAVATSAFDAQPQQFREKWPALQIIGKDILVPAHGIYWLIMLHAIGFPDDQMPQLLVHGWWNLRGAKMSKSIGNIVDPFLLVEKYGAEPVRLFLTGAIATGEDADFSEERLLAYYNSWLANGLGNLVSRTLSMIHRYLGGRLRRIQNKQSTKMASSWLSSVEQGLLLTGETLSYCESFDETPFEEEVSMPKFQVHMAVGAVTETIAGCDRAIEESAPWKLAKDPTKSAELARILYNLTEVIRVIAIWISPMMPNAAHGIFDQLNWKMELSGKEERFSLADAEWGRLPDGHVVGKPVPLFPRIDVHRP
jgi:methionyl-tRNA synthetase